MRGLALQEESKRWEGKTCSQFLTADCSQTCRALLTSFWRVYQSGFYLTFYHTTEELQKIIHCDDVPDHSSGKWESGNGFKCT